MKRRCPDFAVRPAARTSGFHVGHCPDDLCKIVFEGFWAEVDLGSAGHQERLVRGLVAIKLGGGRRLKKVLSPPRGGSGYRGPRAAADRGSDQVGHVSGLCGAEFVEDVLQEPVGGLILTPHIVYRGFNGEDAVDVNWAILEHIGRQHVDGAGIRTGGREGIFGIGSVCRGGGVRQESKSAYGVRNVFEDRLSRGSFPTVRATVVGRDAVLAGDPKRKG